MWGTIGEAVNRQGAGLLQAVIRLVIRAMAVVMAVTTASATLAIGHVNATNLTTAAIGVATVVATVVATTVAIVAVRRVRTANATLTIPQHAPQAAHSGATHALRAAHAMLGSTGLAAWATATRQATV
jgi:hypothetical protein